MRQMQFFLALQPKGREKMKSKLIKKIIQVKKKVNAKQPAYKLPSYRLLDSYTEDTLEWVYRMALKDKKCVDRGVGRRYYSTYANK